jgi:hypothetical protein
MMMALIIYLFYTQTLWLNLHSTQDSCSAKNEPSFITLPPDLPQTLPGHYSNDILLTTNYKRAIIRLISKYNRSKIDHSMSLSFQQ